MSINFTKSNEANIKEINKNLAEGKYTSYLHQIKLNKIRGFEKQVVNFEFPVTAIIAPNGGGKTTILASACIPYMDIEPSVFIQHSRTFDQNMDGWNLEHVISTIQSIPPKTRPLIPNTTKFSTKVAFKISEIKRAWNRRKDTHPLRLPENPRDPRASIVILGIGRTIAAVERSEFGKFANDDFSTVKRTSIGGAKSEQVNKYSRVILGKSVEGYESLDMPRAKESKLTGRSDSFYTGITAKGETFSEFHFGAGESSIIRMVSAIENARDGALILIEEIENGLHPLAIKRMVEYLIDVANRKKLQIIFTTHSNDALERLPDNAVCAVVDWQIYQQGKLNVDLLREMRGETDKKLFIYVEDNFAQTWLKKIVQYDLGIQSDTIYIHPLSADFVGNGGGYGDIPKIVEFHRRIPTPIKTIPAIGYIDGKSGDAKADPSNHVYQLPGGNKLDPEAYIVNSVLEKETEFESILGCQAAQKADYIQQIRKIQTATANAHNLFLNIAEKFHRSKAEVEAEFINLWIKLYPDLFGEITAVIKQYIQDE